MPIIGGTAGAYEGGGGGANPNTGYTQQTASGGTSGSSTTQLSSGSGTQANPHTIIPLAQIGGDIQSFQYATSATPRSNLATSQISAPMDISATPSTATTTGQPLTESQFTSGATVSFSNQNPNQYTITEQLGGVPVSFVGDIAPSYIYSAQKNKYALDQAYQQYLSANVIQSPTEIPLGYNASITGLTFNAEAGNASEQVQFLPVSPPPIATTSISAPASFSTMSAEASAVQQPQASDVSALSATQPYSVSVVGGSIPKQTAPEYSLYPSLSSSFMSAGMIKERMYS